MVAIEIDSDSMTFSVMRSQSFFACNIMIALHIFCIFCKFIYIYLNIDSSLKQYQTVNVNIFGQNTSVFCAFCGLSGNETALVLSQLECCRVASLVYLIYIVQICLFGILSVVVILLYIPDVRACIRYYGIYTKLEE